MSRSYVKVSFEMTNGSELACKYVVDVYPATYWEPQDVSVSDAVYEIDGEEVDFDKLPKGLAAVAERMTEVDRTTKEFTFEEESERDHDFEEPDFDY